MLSIPIRALILCLIVTQVLKSSDWASDSRVVVAVRAYETNWRGIHVSVHGMNNANEVVWLSHLYEHTSSVVHRRSDRNFFNGKR